MVRKKLVPSPTHPKPNEHFDASKNIQQILGFLPELALGVTELGGSLKTRTSRDVGERSDMLFNVWIAESLC